MTYFRGREVLERLSWGLALIGQFCFVFAVVAFSGPGRIDIDDGQTRFEVAQSLVDYGDPSIRDPDITYTVLPGRHGLRYSLYRFPQTLAGVPAILLADATGPVDEGRRHFFFTLTSAVACAGLAVTYALWFHHLGRTRASALAWATAGVFCTPSWFYGTSTFDDIWGSVAVVLAVGIAFMTRRQRQVLGALLAGLALGFAFNCKQPLGIFVLVVLSAHYDRQQAWRAQLGRAVLVLAGLAVGVAAYKAYDFYKFPPGTTSAHAEIIKKWGSNWSLNPLPALLILAVSPAAGCLWYCPTLLLSLRGLATWYRLERFFCLAAAMSSAGFVLFISFLTFFKGDMTWGPRYLTPVFALAWIFVPAGAVTVSRRLAAVVLLAGFTVQLLALSVDVHRLYLQRNLWSRFYVVDPWLYFDPAVAHLLNRPREISDILTDPSPPPGAFTPARSPTDAPPILEQTPGGPEAIHRYRLFRSLRPWWLSQCYLAPQQRPVNLLRTFLLHAATGVAGLGLMIAGCRRSAGTAPPAATPDHELPVRNLA